MQKTYHGSCHCGAVRFEADLDLTQPTYRATARSAPRPEELIAAPVTWVDGLHDNWHNPPSEIRHL